MMATGKKSKKNYSAETQPFVQVLKPTLQEPAWKDLTFGARCLYVTIKSFFNGENNGRIFLGVRKAAAELGASRSSTERWFLELENHGFIVKTKPASLGSYGKGRATCWRLTELGYQFESKQGRPSREYKEWMPKKQNPGIKIGTNRHQNRDSAPSKSGQVSLNS